MSLPLELSRLLRRQLGLPAPNHPVPPDEFSSLVEQVLEESELDTLELKRDPDLWIIRCYLLMAGHTYRRWAEPPPEVPREHLVRFVELSRKAPRARPEFSQSRCDAASTCRRAGVVHRYLAGKGQVLMLGDDDGTSLALNLLAPYRTWAGDLDIRVLRWLKEADPSIETVKLDVRQVPREFHNRFDAVVVDPIRESAGQSFLQAAADCLKVGGLLFWADHPDWNPHYAYMECSLRADFEQAEVLPNWHSYRASFKTVLDDSLHLDEEADRFVALGEMISLWSHLHVHRKRP